MFAFLKRRQLSFALLLLLALCLVLLISFSLGRNRKRDDPTPLTRRTTIRRRLNAHSVSLDSDNDGLPDAAELQSFMDRENFRSWFTLIAEGQFYQTKQRLECGTERLRGPRAFCLARSTATSRPALVSEDGPRLQGNCSRREALPARTRSTG